MVKVGDIKKYKFGYAKKEIKVKVTRILTKIVSTVKILEGNYKGNSAYVENIKLKDYNGKLDEVKKWLK